MDYDAERDLRILTAMADQFEPYMIEEELFWPISGPVSGGMPRLTVGGYLLRSHRLSELRRDLQDGQQAVLDEALAVFRTVKAEWTVHYYRKVEREWHMRLNLLQQFVRDCQDSNNPNCFENWPPQAEHRTVLHHLAAEWRAYAPSFTEQDASLQRLDSDLRAYLYQGETGHFLWLPALAPVYPRPTYWWLWVVPPDDDN